MQVHLFLEVGDIEKKTIQKTRIACYFGLTVSRSYLSLSLSLSIYI